MAVTWKKLAYYTDVLEGITSTIIALGETVTIEEDEQVVISGSYEVEGRIIINDNGRLVLDDGPNDGNADLRDSDIGVKVLAQQTIGIVDDNLIEVDGSPEDNDFAKFTANGLEGRSYSEVRSDINVADGADVTASNETSHADVLVDADIGVTVLAEQTIGIADNNLLEVDGSPSDDEYARFTANGLEGRTVAEVQSSLGINNGNNLLINSGFWACSGGSLATYGAVLEEDDCSIDLTANWTKTNCTLAFDTDHYVMDPSAVDSYVYTSVSNVKQGSLYRISIDVIDGSSAGVSVYLGAWGNDGNHMYWANRKVTTNSYVTYTFIFSQSLGSGTSLPRLHIVADPGGTVFFKNFTFYEVVPQFTGSGGADWHTQTSSLISQRIANDLTHCRGSHGMKITKGVDTDEYYFLNTSNSDTLTALAKYMGQTVTFAAKIYSVTADDNVKLQIIDSNGTTESDFISADSLQTISISRAIETDITSLRFRILLDGDTSDIAYLSQPIAVIGTSIANWSHPANEKIIFEYAEASEKYDGWSSFGTSESYISPQGDSNGAIGRECSAAIVVTNANDSGSAGTLTYFTAGLPTYTYRNYLYGQPNDIPREAVGNIDFDERYEDYIAKIEASGSTFDFGTFEYRGIFVK